MSTVTIDALVVTNDSSSLNQLSNVSVPTSAHNQFLTYNDSAIDGTNPDGWVSKGKVSHDLENVDNQVVPNHDEIFVYNENSQDGNYSTSWVNKNITDLLQGIQVTVEGLVSIENAKVLGESGNAALSDMVAFGDAAAANTSNFTMGIGSCGDNNIIYKREPTDIDFVFLQTLDKGKVSNLTLPAGTVFRSTKGIMGFSSPFPMPFGISSLSSNFFRFYAFRLTNQVYVTSAGLESIVTLYNSDGVTIADGPVTIGPYQSTTLACGDEVTGEFVVVATNAVYCGTSTTSDTDQRLVPPLSNEIIVWNRFNRITAQESNTLVRWYRRNGETGSVTVDAGTPIAIYNGSVNEDVGATNTNAGSNVGYAVDGCLILKSDKPIGAFSGADNSGGESTPGYPLNQLAQLFVNPANIDDNTNSARSSITIGSQYEGEFKVYDNTNTLITTVAITRAISVTVPEDQLYPAAGQWQPASNGITDYTGGYVECNVPSVCIMNLNGSSVWTVDAGDEVVICGSTPDELRANIKKDSDGFFRRRDIDASGVETWNIC